MVYHEYHKKIEVLLRGQAYRIIKKDPMDQIEWKLLKSMDWPDQAQMFQARTALLGSMDYLKSINKGFF